MHPDGLPDPRSRPAHALAAPALVGALASLARARLGAPHIPAGEVSPLADRADRTVVRVGGAVAKAHAVGTDPAALDLRVRIADDAALTGILLPPLPPAGSVRLHGGRTATVWPYGTPVDPAAPSAVPWEAAGVLLARLHAVDTGALGTRLPGPLPAMRGPAKAAEALGRMRAATAGGTRRDHRAAAYAAERVWAGLPAWCRAERPGAGAGSGALCHGDFHLGQLVRPPAPADGWRLIDIDDLGLGDPAWDLARPAAWYAAGLLPPDAWGRLIDAYQHASGTAGADPWPRLDAPARALTAQSVALAVAKASAADRALDEDEEALVESCHRIVELRAEEGP